MRRLPEEESALALVRAGRLGPGHIDALCERLAGFYATAPRADAHGAPAALAAAIDENYRQTLAYAGRFVARALIDRLVAEQRRALAAAEDALRGRVRAGRIREGHGDLRLEHVYFLSRLGGAPVVIDPIEFNAAFRCQDAALDVAFLAMELEAEGRRDLGCYVLGRFAQASNDYGLYPLADLYLGYRAWVRAKVACLVAADAGTPSDKAERKAAEAARLFALAETFARPRPRTGTLVVVGGMIGAGKSTVAHALGLALGAPVISSDVTRKALAGVAATSLEGAALYTERATARTYREMLHRADLVLGSGRDVILDGTFRTARSRRAARELALGHGCRLLFVAVDADDDTLRERLRARVGTASVSDARADLLPWLRRHYQPPVELAPAELLPVDGRTPVGATVDGIVDALVDPARAPVGG
jgi:predicted kinase